MALSTKEYDKFKFLEANRDVVPGHVKALSKSIALYPELGASRPILVNENFEIIDGQHRFTIWKEMGLPIHYTVEKGLGAKEAIELNKNQRNWGLADWAKTWAKSGNKNYQTFLEFQEEYSKYPPNVIMSYLRGGQTSDKSVDFREGKFEVGDTDQAREWLDQLEELSKVSKTFRQGRAAVPLLTVMKSDNYDQNRMVQKFTMYGDTFIPYGTKKDIMRSLEDVYNFRQREGTQVRLY